ncbi:hypothetical protein AURDEDRAFT_127896 [Auricularia subglabra TFB-10046 SS5]|nr:hypothetical protein AURDEDRAFT_127896 [Auricularia subglabra TFB-10046 SS5]
MGDALRDAALEMLDGLKARGLKLMDVLDTIFWGDSALIGDARLRGARTSFTHDPRLSGLLSRLCSPPRTGKAQTKAVSGASAALDDFAWQHVYDRCLAEIEAYEPTTVFKTDEIDIFSIQDITLAGILDDVTSHAPRLFALLCDLMQTDRQRSGNTDKNPSSLAVVIINIITYSRSSQRSKLQKMNALFFKAAGVPTRVFDVLQSFGLSMSSTWVSKLFDGLCERSELQMRDNVWRKPWFGLYDNVRFNIHADSQRIYNQTLGVNCTALTVLLVPIEWLPALVDRGLNMKQLLQVRLQDPNKAPYIAWKDFIRRDERITLHRFSVSRVLAVLWDLPELSQSPHRGHDVLRPPEPVLQVPPRKVEYHMLGTVPLDEVSYEGNDQVIEEVMKQTGYDTPEGRQKICNGYGVPFCGDLLTIKRLRGLQQLQAEDENSYDRKSYMDLAIGWFHVQMNLDRQVFLTHRGTVSSDGLAREANMLNWHGLSAGNDKPEYHTVDEFLHHVFVASTLDCWLWATQTASLVELVEWVSAQTDPEAILRRANIIVRMRQSSVGLQHLELEADRLTAEAASAAAPSGTVLPSEGLEDAVPDTIDVSDADDSDGDVPSAKRRRIADDTAPGDPVDSAPVSAPAPRARKRKRKQAPVGAYYDDVLANRIRLNRDLNLREVLRDRVRHGDVGALRLLIPRLAIMFKGGGNGSYGTEMLEQFQWLEHEDFIMKNCWLVNTQGHRDSFLPTDQFQEHNNRKLRDWQDRCGANLSLDYIKKISPIIPVLDASVQQMLKHFALPYRSKVHKVPDATTDIKALLRRFQLRRMSEYVAGRLITDDAARPKDNEANGLALLQDPQTIAEWREEREMHRKYATFAERLENPSLPIEYETIVDSFGKLSI